MDIRILELKFCDYSSFIRGYSPHTVTRYKEAIDYYCKVAQVSQINQVTENNVRDFFFFGRTQKGWQANTFICYHVSLGVFFKWCVREGYLKQDPTERIETPRLEKKLPSKLSKQESLRLLEIVYNYPYSYTFLRYRNHAMYSMFVFAGLRKSELLNLKLTDVDLENLTLFVRLGKGNKDRIIPVSFTLAQTLNRYLIERKRLNKTCAEFFTSLNKNTGFSNGGLKKLNDKIKRASRLKFTIHKLRHTFATLMLEGGCDIYSLSRMMGHSDIKTTTIYLSASAEHLRSQMIKHPLNEMIA
jgi:site-specific recombinase XerD